MSNTAINMLPLIEALAEKHLVPADADFANTLANSSRHGLPKISVTALQGQHLSVLTQLLQARRVLEIGTLGGYSTMWFAKAGARVTSIEINHKHRAVALENLRGAGLEADILHGAALDVLPQLADGEKFDFVFIDADWGEQWEYFDWAVRLTRKGGAIYVDNVVQVMMEDGEEGAKSEDSLVARVGRDVRVRASLVPIISANKGSTSAAFVDGFMLAVVL
jgi:predicted O-methyltransferase YrrM